MTTSHVHLPRSTAPTGRVRMCARCDVDKPVDGGCEVAPRVWNCFDCWRQRRLTELARGRERS